jgi:hypothetical protein
MQLPVQELLDGAQASVAVAMYETAVALVKVSFRAPKLGA